LLLTAGGRGYARIFGAGDAAFVLEAAGEGFATKWGKGDARLKLDALALDHYVISYAKGDALLELDARGAAMLTVSGRGAAGMELIARFGIPNPLIPPVEYEAAPRSRVFTVSADPLLTVPAGKGLSVPSDNRELA